MKNARITPYKYYNYGEERIVYIDEDNKHPDPSKRLFWGYESNGDFLSGDYKNKFTKAGKTITITVIGKYMTASDETKAKVKAITEYLKTH